VKSISHLPVIVDPSHASGTWKYVTALSMAAIAAGADGLLVEVHPNPKSAKCDSQQQLTPETFAAMVGEIREMVKVLGRTL
jgi:3-deoxy-7-phosphoheptulonate synthase